MNLKISIYALLTLKKPQKDRQNREKSREKATKNQRDAKEADNKKKRENVKLIKMKLSRTQGVRERKRGREGEGRFVAEACNIYNL